MKIAVNARFLLKDRIEGIGRYSYEISKRLVEQHPNDEFFFLFDREYSDEFIFGQNVTPVVLFPPARHPFLWYLWFEWAVPSALKKYKVDVLFSPDGYCSIHSKVPTLLCMHDIAFVHFPDLVAGLVSRYYHYFTPKYLKKADRIVTVSSFVKKDIESYYGIPDSKIALTYNGCQPEFVPLELNVKEKVKAQYSAGKDYFLFVGAVHPRKNVHRLIAAFDAFKKQTNAEVKLLIAGRFAWQTGEVKSAFDASSFQNDIHFLGFVPTSELPQLMAAALALTYVSLSEGFGIPLLEAMHCEVPIITSNVSSMPEIAGEAAILVDPSDVSEIENAMFSVYSSPALRQNLIENGRKVRTRFNWDSSAAKVYEILHQIAKS